MKCQKIAADTLAPVTMYTFDELDYGTQDDVTRYVAADNADSEREQMAVVAFDHFPNSDCEFFIAVDRYNVIHEGIYGTFELSDLLDDCDYFPHRLSADYGRVTIECPTVTAKGDIVGEWIATPGYAQPIEEALSAGGYRDSDAWECHAAALRICEHMASWADELAQYALDSTYEYLCQYDEGLYDENGIWQEYAQDCYRMPIEDPDADTIECPDADAARDCIRQHCKCLGYREDAILADMAECVRVQFDASHEVWRVTDTDGASACFDLASGRVCG